ncbi:MAG: hypothetical protein JNL53_02945 [Cyclobacteriaceae bacterium]|nr:hypothetical protein [Cyclobacteriaceae bacterium]
MKPERKKALVSISITLIIGILIGGLTVGLLGRNIRGSRPQAGFQEEGRERFVQKLLEVAEADAEQAKQLRPLIYETMDKVDSLQKKTDRDVESVVDALELKLKPILSDKQMEQLQQFHRRGRGKNRKQ